MLILFELYIETFLTNDLIPVTDADDFFNSLTILCNILSDFIDLFKFFFLDIFLLLSLCCNFLFF